LHNRDASTSAACVWVDGREQLKARDLTAIMAVICHFCDRTSSPKRNHGAPFAGNLSTIVIVLLASLTDCPPYFLQAILNPDNDARKAAEANLRAAAASHPDAFMSSLLGVKLSASALHILGTL
jgi:hypothetical protein